MISRAAIVVEARSWIGTRWHHQASCKGAGSDCIGFVVGVAKACGVLEADEFLNSSEFRGYGRQPDPQHLLEGCERWLDRINIADATIADILLFRFVKGGGAPQHFALISSENPRYIIHAYAQARRVIEQRLLQRDPLMKLSGAYRFRGLA